MIKVPWFSKKSKRYETIDVPPPVSPQQVEAIDVVRRASRDARKLVTQQFCTSMDELTQLLQNNETPKSSRR